MEVKGPAEIKMFCKDFVEDAEFMFVLATAACMLVIVSLVHFLMALSANYAHIRGHDKFIQLQDLQVRGAEWEDDFGGGGDPSFNLRLLKSR